MFFILKLMNDLSVRSSELMANKSTGSGDIPVLLGYTVMIVVLAQAMLAAASALNVKNVSAATSWVKGAVIGGTAAVGG